MSENDSVRHLVLFDGVCGLCHRFVRIVLRGDPRSVFLFASLQSDTGRRIVEAHGGDPQDLDTLYVVVDYGSDRDRVLERSDAVVFILARLKFPWWLLTGARIVPAALRDLVYGRLAASRYRRWGTYDRCPQPAAEDRSRFVDVG